MAGIGRKDGRRAIGGSISDLTDPYLHDNACSVKPRQLSEDEFKETFKSPMQNVSQAATNVIDIWRYVEAVTPTELQGHLVVDGVVELVYRSGDGHYDHVLVMTRTKNVYLVVVVDLWQDSIFGHRLLDLNAEYGFR